MSNRQSRTRFVVISIAVIALSALAISANWGSGYGFNLFGPRQAAPVDPQLTVPVDAVGEPDLTNEDSATLRRQADEDKAAKQKVEQPAGQDVISPSGNLIGATTYAFTATSSIPLEDMSSGTTLLEPADLDDTASAIAPIGFDFWYDGVRQTMFSTNANGLMRLGTTVIDTAFSNSLASTTDAPKIAPYWDDLWIGNNGKVHYKVVGSAPNRKLVVEWQNEQIPRVATANAGAGTFQAWLFESTGVVEFVYGSGIAANATNSGASIGLQSGVATNFASVTASTNTVSYAAANDANTVAIPSGTAYIFTPNTPVAPTGLNFTAVGLNTETLNWSDNASNEFGYAIYRSLDGTNYDFVTLTAANATSSVQTGLASNTSYFWRVQAVTEGAVSSNLSGSQATTTGTRLGTFTVGPTGTYLSVTAAVADLNTNGLAGNVILELQPTYLSAVETFPLVISTLGSPSNTVTIRPATGAAGLSISSADATATIDMNVATNVIIDGRAGGVGASQLTISNTNTTGVAVRLINGSSRNTIQYTTMQGVNTSSSSGVVLFSTSTGATGNNNNTIDNCSVTAGATTPVNDIMSLGTTNAALINTGNTISNNNISDFHNATTASNGINVNTSSSKFTITNNRIFQTAARASTGAVTHRGILVVTSVGFDHTITGNTVGFANAAGTGTYTMTSTGATGFVGIQMQAGTSPTGGSIQGNTVAGISQTTTTGSLIGISLTAGNANIGGVSGNTVGSGTGNGSLTNTPTGAAFIVGLNVSGATVGTVTVANNTIGSLTATGNPSTVNPNLNVVQLTGGAVTFSNNLLGSNTTANSIQTTTAGTSATAQQLIAMLCGSTMPITISGNTIANITNFGTGTAHVIRGPQIQSPGVSSTASAGKGTISGNTIHDITGSNANTATAGATNGILFTTGTGGVPSGGDISGNTVYTINATNAGAVATYSVGIALSGASSTVGVTNATMTKNKVYDIRNASTGVTATTPPVAAGIVAITATTSAQISNNMISLGNAQTTNTEFAGIINNFATSATMQAYYNSVHIEGTSAGGALPSFGFLRGDNTAASAITSPIDARNNIFDNARTGGTSKYYAIGNVNTTPATGWGAGASNFNVLNSSSAATVGIWGLATDETFATWKTDSASDGSSVSGVSVPFVAPATGDLHVNFGLTPTALESGGTVIAGLTIDYDNQTRPGPPGSVNGGGTSPDIGADEFDGVPLDVAPPVITYTAFTNTTSTANRVLTPVNITDFTGVANGALLPRIYFKKSTDAGYVSTQCVMTGGTAQNGNYDCTINYALVGGGSVTGGDTVQYFVIAQDTVTPTPNVGTNPGGATATSVNSVITPPGSPNTYFIQPFISGNKTVGTGGDYPTLTAAVAALNGAVLNGPLNLTLTDPTYAGSETFPLTINANSGSSAANRVTIKPGPGNSPVITGSSASCLLIINGADFVTVDGSNGGGSPAGTSRDATYTNTNTGTSSAVVCIETATGPDSATNNIVKNNNLTGTTVTATDGTLFGVFSGSSTISITSTGTANNNNTIQNNSISKVAIGIYSGGASAANKNTGTVITQNVMNSGAPTNLNKGGILVNNDDGTQVTQNDISVLRHDGTAGQTTTAYGIALGVVPNNTVTAFTGLDVTNATVRRNKINGITQLNSTGYSAFGIVINSVTSGTTTVDDNMISGVVSASTASDFSAGILAGGGTGSTTRVYFNSVAMTGARGAATFPSYGLAIGGGNPGMDVRNNIFYNTQTSTSTGKMYAIGGVTTPVANFVSNHNNFFVSGASEFVGQTNGLGTSGADQLALSDWQAATGQDTTFAPDSQAVDPLFVNPANNLHLQPNVNGPMINGAVPIAGILFDFDGQNRIFGAAPDIGADELFPPVAADNLTLSGRVLTSDGRGIRNASVILTGGGLSQPLYAQTGSFGWYSFTGLQAGQTYIVSVGTKRFVFSNTSRVVSLSDDLTDCDFVADP